MSIAGVHMPGSVTSGNPLGTTQTPRFRQTSYSATQPFFANPQRSNSESNAAMHSGGSALGWMAGRTEERYLSPGLSMSAGLPSGRGVSDGRYSLGSSLPDANSSNSVPRTMPSVFG